MIKDITRFSFPTSIIFGPGAIGELPGEFTTMGVKKPLIVTDGNMEKTDAFKSLLDVFINEQIDFQVFSGVQPNPHDVDVENGVAVYSSSNCDFIIAGIQLFQYSKNGGIS